MSSTCSKCGAIFNTQTADDQRSSCSICGSATRRIVEDCVTDRVIIGDSIRGVAYKGGVAKRKGLRWDLFTGFELSTSLQRLVQKTRLIDKESDRYTEPVVDSKTGEVLVDVDEPLSEHQGHGAVLPFSLSIAQMLLRTGERIQ